MTLSELEQKLQTHANRVKRTFSTPFTIEREELTMEKRRFGMKKAVLLVAAIVCVFGTTVFAAVRYLSPRDVADKLGETELAQLFDKQGYASETVTDGKYKSTMLGITTGENLNNFESSNWEVINERTYAVVAVEKSDGTAMTPEDEVMATPLIFGQKPWECNIFTMAGGHTEEIIDGILYRIIEFSNIEYFADRTVYMAIYEGFAPSSEIFVLNADGSIAYNEGYEGSKALFEIPLDPAKADPVKAEELLRRISFNESYEGEESTVELPDELPEETTPGLLPELKEVKVVTINPDFTVTEEVVLEETE